MLAYLNHRKQFLSSCGLLESFLFLFHNFILKQIYFSLKASWNAYSNWCINGCVGEDEIAVSDAIDTISWAVIVECSVGCIVGCVVCSVIWYECSRVCCFAWDIK